MREIVQTEKPSQCLDPGWPSRDESRLQTYLQDGPAPLLAHIPARMLLGRQTDFVHCSLEVGYAAAGIGAAVAVVGIVESCESVESSVLGAE